MRFGVQLGITDNIWVGKLNKNKTMFTNKEDKTVEVINAVMELIKKNDAKGMTTELKDSNTRYILSLETKAIIE